MRCRVLPHEVRDGPANMAWDEALLDAIDAGPASAALRTYGWSEPTLSLGYFQALADVATDPRWRDVPVVRRPTGGGALWHDREVTYALALPRSHPAAAPPTALYRAVHGAIAGALAARGIVAGRRGGGGPPTGPRPFLCFGDRDPEDLVRGGAKLVGSAQRRRPRAVLVHGALLLGRSPATPELLGLADLAGGPADPDPWAEVLRAAIPAGLGLAAVADEATPAERDRAAELEWAVYRDPGWTGRR